jgi:hypothetical protein
MEFNKIRGDERAEYFAQYTSASLGRVKKLYLKWARLKGPLSPECQQLNRLFSQCVDGNRIKVPANLEDPSEPPPDSPQFVLDALHDAATSAILTSVNQDAGDAEYTRGVMDVLANRENLAISEFELVQMLLKRCHKYGEDFNEYAESVSYSALSDEQRAWLLNRLPHTDYYPKIVLNGLLQLDLVQQTELQRFGLDHPALHWRPVFKSQVDRMGRFLNVTSRALELFHKKLIVLQADERLTLMIYHPSKIERQSEVQVDASVRVFALPRSAGPDSAEYRVTPTKVNYRVYCDDGQFQLYEKKRANTFVYLARAATNKALLRDGKGPTERRKLQAQAVQDGATFECRASVALDRISEPIKLHVGRMNRAGIFAAVRIILLSSKEAANGLLMSSRRSTPSATETSSPCRYWTSGCITLTRKKSFHFSSRRQKHIASQPLRTLIGTTSHRPQ